MQLSCTKNDPASVQWWESLPTPLGSYGSRQSVDCHMPFS